MMIENPFSLNSKNIIITGASSGIGRQCAISCSEMGARVFLIARNAERLSETLSLMYNVNIHSVIVLDVTDYEKIENVIQSIVTEFGKINGFVHCAGKELTLPLISMKPSYYQEMYAVNVVSAFEFAKQISKKKYSSSGNCSLVFIGSVMGVVGEIAHVSYCATKGALVSGAKALALELAEKKIRVNTLSPAQIEGTQMTQNMLNNNTDKTLNHKLLMHPLGYGKSLDVANACIYLLSNASSWVTGTNMIIDGGYTSK
jgi:NAD(P)-dependent dehydrogenase (short-subunit alcohol dehydrogenase family)